MPTVSGSLKLVTNSPALVSQVWVRSTEVRPSGSAVIIDDPDIVLVSNGDVSFSCEPGPAVLALSYVGGLPTKTIPLLVGTDTAQTLGSAVQAALAADGADYTALEQLKQEMSTLLGSVLAEADKAVAVLGSVEAASVSALESKQSAADYAEAASVSASYAKSSEDSARGSAEAADAAVSQAGVARDAASQSASQAGESARAAAASASEASESADRAQLSAEQAGEAATNASISAVAAKVDELTRDAPEAFDTLAEIAAELEEGTSARAALTKQIAEKADLEHTHTTADVEGLDVALSGKAEKSHTHTTSQIEGLDTALADKADKSHSHEMSQVTGLSDALAGKAATSHTHAISQVEGLESRLSVVESQIPKIQVVTALPASPDPSTIYLVKES